ncbi:MAG: ribonuclease III [Rhodobacteraceae bacterium]|nr:ribonuclease III [Paracoccaceae bacterium]
MNRAAELTALSDRLEHRFKSPELLLEALTHSSLSMPARPDNQRLEFLGDRVLGLVIAEALLKADPTAAEGQLAPRLNALVRKETCADVASGIDLGGALQMGRAEQSSGGRRKQTILADAMEAVIAAVYRDAGFEAARALVLRLWAKRITDAEKDARDAKTALQEWAQARGMPPPDYTEVDRRGKDHAPIFVIEARLENNMSARGRARNKRTAQQAAAKVLLAEAEASDD